MRTLHVNEIGKEQFLSTFPPEKRLWEPTTCIKAGVLVDKYDQARKAFTKVQNDKT